MRPKRRQPALRVVLLRKLTTGQMSEDSERTSRTGSDSGGSASLRVPSVAVSLSSLLCDSGKSTTRLTATEVAGPKRLLPSASDGSLASAMLVDPVDVERLFEEWAALTPEQQLKKAKACIVELADQVWESRNRAKDLEGKLKDADGKVTALKGEIEEYEERVAAYEERVKNLEGNVGRLEANLALVQDVAKKLAGLLAGVLGTSPQ